MAPGEEPNLPYSYFPYQVDFKLVLKSSYSASANPALFTFLHLTGTLLRSARSMNARFISDTLKMPIVLNAGIVAYVHTHTFDMAQVYKTEKPDSYKKESPSQTDTDLASALNHCIHSKDPLDWITHLSATDHRMPPQVRDFIVKVACSKQNSRKVPQSSFLSLRKS